MAPSVSPREKTALMERRGMQMSARELRTRVDDVVPLLISAIAQMANAVRSGSVDRDVQRRALLLELEAVPVIYRAAFQPDPLAAALDLWLLVYQLEDCVVSGRAACDFGDQRAAAAASMGQVRGELESEYRRVSVNLDAFERSRGQLQQLARAHPLAKESIVRRHALTTELAAILGSETRDVFSVMGDVEASLEDLSRRLNIYVGDVPTLARWQVELALDDALRRPEFGRALSSVERVTDATARALDPEGIEALLDGAFARFRAERSVALTEVDRQRTLSLASIDAQLDAALEGIDHQGQRLLEQLHRERVESLREGERMLETAMARATKDAFAVIDHLIWRVALLLASMFLVASASWWWLRVSRARAAATRR